MISLTAHYEQEWAAPLLPSSLSTRWARWLDGFDADLAARDPVFLVAASRSDADSPIEYLPHLAAERSVNEFSSAWPEARQRAVTRASFRFHQVQGTRPALDRALSPLGYRATVVEWFERDLRQPYTFRLVVDLGAEPWTVAQRRQLVRVANNAKNLRSKLEAVELFRRIAPTPVYVGGLVVRRRTLRIYQQPREITRRSISHVYVGALVSRRRTIRIGPRP